MDKAVRGEAVERPAMRASSPSGAEHLTELFWTVPPSIQVWRTRVILPTGWIKHKGVAGFLRRWG